jgi:N-acetyl-gamma-glutamyl-phosphate reductase
VNRVLVAGASGYAGALAAELVNGHPELELARVTARTDAGRRLDDLYPQYGVDLVLEEPDAEDGSDVDAAIVAYPHGAAAPVVAALRAQDVKVVDLSADFRLHDLDTYGRWYGDHGAPELVESAVYGLTELHREAIAGAELVANPGCYPTASLLALAPLAGEGLIEDVVIDAKSGVSGAGKAVAEEMAVVKESDDARPYKVTAHRHTPEIAQELSELSELSGNGAAPLTFVPHLLPFDQGELVSCYVRTADPVDMTTEPPGVSGVRETNLCRIHLAQNEGSGRVLVFASIDNLWKGAASQAIQNLNLMLGLPEVEGIS